MLGGNVIWYQYDMAERQQEEMQLRTPMRQQSFMRSFCRRFLQRQKEPLQTFGAGFGNTPLTDASERAISLHAQCRFTQLLGFVCRKEMARCRGLSLFSAARTLFSSPLKIAIVGSAGVGKKAFGETLCWVTGGWRGTAADDGVCALREDGAPDGSAAGHAMLHTYGTPGEPCFEDSRRFICSNRHAAGL
ncbi:putative small GTP-binding protein Rab7 [Trypanosoma rangeli]|uniref:Putative small GTP-binding protein Rab7 n=1 Tax=Trypanosoma rangeli TaxID=5698 RepID=A0A3R7JVJ5_TRYRA|nr:putative small GTP-binding protein Rab7 [Trypanosoma rangeli]RNE97511.1 putative small GTP-binding protein Rab7 [Trypanosoma rangeli]|eukprot:RNE97511.1 putative small GTP-binding protein Rab7 [Trypanosoma rangeli]